MSLSGYGLDASAALVLLSGQWERGDANYITHALTADQEVKTFEPSKQWGSRSLTEYHNSNYTCLCIYTSCCNGSLSLSPVWYNQMWFYYLIQHSRSSKWPNHQTQQLYHRYDAHNEKNVNFHYNHTELTPTGHAFMEQAHFPWDSPKDGTIQMGVGVGWVCFLI